MGQDWLGEVYHRWLAKDWHYEMLRDYDEVHTERKGGMGRA